MKKEDWAAVFCSMIFGLVGGFIAYEMKPALCWVGAIIGATLGFFTCEPQCVMDGLRHAKTAYREQEAILLAHRGNFNWRRAIKNFIDSIGYFIVTTVGLCLCTIVAFFWIGIIAYPVWRICHLGEFATLVGVVPSVIIIVTTVSKADLDFSPDIASDFFKIAFISSPVAVLFYWLPHVIIPKFLPIWIRALWRAAKFFLNYLATHRAVLVALSIFVGVIVGRFCGHVLFCGGISGALCLAGILIREYTGYSPVKA